MSILTHKGGKEELLMGKEGKRHRKRRPETLVLAENRWLAPTGAVIKGWYRQNRGKPRHQREPGSHCHHWA